MRVLCLLLPHFPFSCEAQRCPAIKGCPSLLVHTSGSQRLVLDYSPDLERLRSGMALQEALSRHSQVKLIPADMARYRSIFNELLDSLEQKSPLVEGSELGCAYLGLDGLGQIYRSYPALIGAVREVIPEVFESRIGVAEGKFPAYLAALYSSPDRPRIINPTKSSILRVPRRGMLRPLRTPASGPPQPAAGHITLVRGDMEDFLRDLPSDVLPVSAKARKKLQDFGLHTLGQVAALSLSPLQAQFGSEGRRIWELARGHDATPLYPRRSEEVIEESITLPSVAVSLEAVLAAVESLLGRVFARDMLQRKGISSLTLWANLWGSGYWERGIQLKEPAVDMGSVLSRTKHVLEASPPPGPVEELGLRVTRLSPVRGRQRSLFSEVRARDSLQQDIRQMEFRLGSPQVFRIKGVEPWSRIPERRQRLTPVSQ